MLNPPSSSKCQITNHPGLFAAFMPRRWVISPLATTVCPFIADQRRLVGRPAAVNRNRATSDAAGRVGAEEYGVGRHLGWLQQPVNRRLVDHDFLDHLALRDIVDPRLIGDLLLH